MPRGKLRAAGSRKRRSTSVCTTVPLKQMWPTDWCGVFGSMNHDISCIVWLNSSSSLKRKRKKLKYCDTTESRQKHLVPGMIYHHQWLRSYLQHLDALRSDKEGNANANEGQADEEKPRDDNASREHGLPCRKPLLSEGGVVRPVGEVLLLLHHFLDSGAKISVVRLTLP